MYIINVNNTLFFDEVSKFHFSLCRHAASMKFKLNLKIYNQISSEIKRKQFSNSKSKRLRISKYLKSTWVDFEKRIKISSGKYVFRVFGNRRSATCIENHSNF